MRSGKLEKEILILFAILFVGYGFYKSMSGCKNGGCSKCENK